MFYKSRRRQSVDPHSRLGRPDDTNIAPAGEPKVCKMFCGAILIIVIIILLIVLL